MPLTPILRRTLAIFRERPLLFIVFPLLFSLPFLAYPVWFNSLSVGPMRAIALCFLVWICIGSALVYAFIVSLVLEAEEHRPISAARAWQRVRHQPHLAGTALMIEFFFIGVVYALGLVQVVLEDIILRRFAPIGSHAYAAGLWVFASVDASIFALIFVPLALAIPLVLIRRSAAPVAANILDESRRLSTGIFWPIVIVILVSGLPEVGLSGIGKLIHLPASIATPAAWIGKLLVQLIASVFTSMSYIALALIALNRSAADPQQETVPSTSPQSHTASQVVIL